MARRITAVPLATLLILGAMVTDSPAQDPRGTPPTSGNSGPRRSEVGHDRMLRTLEDLRIRSATDNVYTGTEAQASLRGRLEALPDSASRSDRVALLLEVGRDDLRLGRDAQAVERLGQAYELTGGRDAEVSLQLAIAHMRVGESANCIHHRNPASCILPIRGGAIHRDRTGALAAMQYLEEVLNHQPDHLVAKWLLNLAAMLVGEYPGGVPKSLLVPPESFEPEGVSPQFTDVAADRGLDTVGLSGGVVADDFDNDGWLDVIVSDWSPDGQLRYFGNQGEGRFEERTLEADLTGLYGGLNLVQADYDNDGNIDILVLRGAWLEETGRRYPNSLLRNLGGGRFRDVTFEAGLAEEHFPTQTAAWGDYDLDGNLDLFVGNEYAPSQLFRNSGDGTFEEVSVAAGISNNDFAKASVWGDYDADGDPDLFISNFGGPNRLFRNNGDGSFTDVAANLGLELPLHSFPAWFWDYDNDGALDLYVSGYQWDVADVAATHLGLPALRTEPDRLYKGDGSGQFREVGADRGVARITQPMGSNFGDIDNDGFADFYLGTGYPAYEGLMPNLLLRNAGGLRFEDVSAHAGVGHLQKGHGVAFADFDHDGDQDIFVVIGGAFAGDVYANALFDNHGSGNSWIEIKLEGTESNRAGIGARIRAELRDNGENRSVFRWVNSGGSFGANPLRQHLGLGNASEIHILEVQWPASGLVQRFESVAANQRIAIQEGASEYRQIDPAVAH